MCECARLASFLGVLHTNRTPGYARAQIAGLDSLLLGPLELFMLLERDHPETGHGLVEVAVSLGAVALNERRSTEVLQTGARRLQRLSATAVTHSRVLKRKEERLIHFF